MTENKTIDVLITEMQKDIEYIKKWVDKLDNKFATKWVERVMIFQLWWIWLWVIGALLKLILN